MARLPGIPRCPKCKRILVIESPIYGGPDEWRCLVCPVDDPPEPEPAKARAA